MVVLKYDDAFIAELEEKCRDVPAWIPQTEKDSPYYGRDPSTLSSYERMLHELYCQGKVSAVHPSHQELSDAKLYNHMIDVIYQHPRLIPRDIWVT